MALSIRLASHAFLTESRLLRISSSQRRGRTLQWRLAVFLYTHVPTSDVMFFTVKETAEFVDEA